MYNVFYFKINDSPGFSEEWRRAGDREETQIHPVRREDHNEDRNGDEEHRYDLLGHRTGLPRAVAQCS